MCGGTVAAWAKEGTTVHYWSPTAPPATTSRGRLEDSIRPVREAEQRTAAEILGVGSVTFLGFVDGELGVNLETRRAVTRVVRRIRPEVLVAPDPSRLWFANPSSTTGTTSRRARCLCAVMPDAPSRPQFAELLDEASSRSRSTCGSPPTMPTPTWISPRRSRPRSASLEAHVSRGVGLDGLGPGACPRAGRGGFEYAEVQDVRPA